MQVEAAKSAETATDKESLASVCESECARVCVCALFSTANKKLAIVGQAVEDPGKLW